MKMFVFPFFCRFVTVVALHNCSTSCVRRCRTRLRFTGVAAFV